MASSASRAAMRSKDFQRAAVGMGFALLCGVLFVVISFVLPLSRVAQFEIWQCALLAFFVAGAHARKRPIIWYPLAALILKPKPNHKPKPPAAY
uniref:Uncharacterized protein n=1 Tax=Oryza punctata TaxID=4537 RepID=A0A0E0JGR0_ORYPU